MMKLLRKIQVNKSGASAAEYALIIALVGGAIVIGAATLGSGISNAFSGYGASISATANKLG